MLVDSYGRVIDYLRISLTQKCNFRCLYCMPKVPFEYVPKENVLTYEELFLFVKLFIDKGGKKIRLTGGEPLVRKDVYKFIKMINDYKNDIDIALTTNAFLLEEQAADLYNAGLKRINISLDTLDEKKAKMLSQKNILPNVLRGIDKALELGFKIKTNCVALKNINENELCDVLDYSKDRGIEIRFIEFMENHHAYGQLKGLKSNEILEQISKKYNITQIDKKPNSPASLYRLDDGYVFGIIDPHKHDFCSTCNRLRLTAEGFLIPCLYFDESMSIKKALQENNIEKALQILEKVLENKPEKNRWSEDTSSSRAFFQTGG